MNRVIVIGGGAAGFFTAINIKRKCPELQVTILEKTSRVLQKVKVSGGGRCNVTNGRIQPSELIPFYPRGGKKLYSIFKVFGTEEMRGWLSKYNVPTVVEEDQRVFPSSNDSQTIIDSFLGQCRSQGIEIVNQCEVLSFKKQDDVWTVETNKGSYSCNYLIMTAGASGKTWKMLSDFGLRMNEQVPSLFTFHVNDNRIKDLPGVSFLDVSVKIAGTKLVESGPLLITHWGFSGPAVLKLSAWGAVELAKKEYQFSVIINFSGLSFDECKRQLEERRQSNPKRLIKNESFDGIPRRYWEQVLKNCEVESRTFGDLGKAHINKLCEELTQANFLVKGKSAFKEEFVTCGGVDLSELSLESMEAKRFTNLFLAGEVIDIDALTGGFNFQACWSEGWLISEHINKIQHSVKGGL